MPIQPIFRSIPKDVVEWGRFFRDAVISTTDGQVTDDSFAPRTGLSVIGRSASTTGQPADINASANSQFLGRRSDVVGFFGILDADIPSSIARDTEVTAAIVAHEGLPDPHPGYALQSSGTFTGTLTGCTTSPTETLRYSIAGSVVTLYMPQLNATSNTTACTITGAPSEIFPARLQRVAGVITDNSITAFGTIQIEVTGVITLGVGAGFVNFTAANVKGVLIQTICYSLD